MKKILLSLLIMSTLSFGKLQMMMVCDEDGCRTIFIGTQGDSDD